MLIEIFRFCVYKQRSVPTGTRCVVPLRKDARDDALIGVVLVDEVMVHAAIVLHKRRTMAEEAFQTPPSNVGLAFDLVPGSITFRQTFAQTLVRDSIISHLERIFFGVMRIYLIGYKIKSGESCIFGPLPQMVEIILGNLIWGKDI